MFYERVTVINTHDDGLTRDVYTFWLDDRTMKFVLDEYREEYKQTPRHKWRVSDGWSRMNKRFGHIRREQIDIPASIREMALNELIKRITIE